MSEHQKSSRFESNRAGKFSELMRSDKSDVAPIRRAADRAYFGHTFEKGGDHPVSAAIDFLLSDGSSFGIFYFGLLTPIVFSPGTGTTAQQIKLKTQDWDITISGKNLYAVYEYLLEQRLVWIKEADSSFVESEEGQVVVESIEMEERE